MANEANLPTLSEALLPAPTRRRQSLAYVWPIGISAMAILALYFSRKSEVSLLDVVMSFLLIMITCVLYRQWTANNDTRDKWSAAPLLLVLAIAFSQMFAIGLFWSSHTVTNIDRGEYELRPDSCTTALLMAVVSLGAIYYGAQLRLADAFSLPHLPYLKDERRTWNYCRIILAVGIATTHLGEAAGSLDGLRQIFLNVIFFVPLTAFCILFRRYLDGGATTTDKVLLLAFAANKVFAGIASGWLGAAVAFLLIAMTVYVASRNRLPAMALVILVAYTLFMQPGKTLFRQEYWYGGREGSPIERAMFWVQASATIWGDVLSNRQSDVDLSTLLDSTTGRTSLVNVTAQVVEYVPSVIPYQNGKTYGFLLVSWIPRALWPGKPSASEVNMLYQTTFRLTFDKDLATVSLAPGIVGEAYWNFGWAGVIMMSLLLGLLIRFVEVQFARRSSGMLLNAVVVIAVPQFLSIESHMGTYIGGLLLQFFVILAAFAPVCALRPRASFSTETHQ